MARGLKPTKPSAGTTPLRALLHISHIANMLISFAIVVLYCIGKGTVKCGINKINYQIFCGICGNLTFDYQKG